MGWPGRLSTLVLSALCLSAVSDRVAVSCELPVIQVTPVFFWGGGGGGGGGARMN